MGESNTSEALRPIAAPNLSAPPDPLTTNDVLETQIDPRRRRLSP
jgi:hypothetical protein